MNVIVLKQDGVITEKDSPDKIAFDVLVHLSSRLEFDSRVTLRSFFSMLKFYPDLARLSAFSGALLEQYLKAGEALPPNPDFDRIEISKNVEMTGYPGEPGVTIYQSVSGVREDMPIPLKFYHLESLLDVPFRLGKLKHVIFGDTDELFEFETFFTLFELIDGVFWELSFNFNPLQCEIRR